MNKLLFGLLAATFLTFGCNKFDELDGVNYEIDGAEFAIPLGSAQFSMSDLFDNVEENTFYFLIRTEPFDSIIKEDLKPKPVLRYLNLFKKGWKKFHLFL
ncbi:MAG: hypothetical protein R2769_08885 [Saprospiraceae bacterium]